ncbi:hypothetical protein G9298_18130 [Bacillus thuringiensis]|nr:hypothetical protein G9298_18130 [Bacillus thuringiensis]
MVIINMLDGEKIEIHKDTILVGLDNVQRINTNEPGQNTFYLKQMYYGCLEWDVINQKSPSLVTDDERLGIGGFILSHDMFSVGDDPNATFYLTSAVKSISVV